MRKLISSGSPFEPRIGFSRAVRIGPFVAVSGTAPIAADGGVAAPGDLYGQTRRCLEIIAQAIGNAGLGLKDVIRTRTYLVDIAHWEAVGRVHGEVFGDIRPVSTHKPGRSGRPDSPGAAVRAGHSNRGDWRG